MGMQVSSLSAGGGFLAAAKQEIHHEKRLRSISEEQKPDAGQTTLSLPGDQETRASDLRQTTAELEQISSAFNRRLKFETDQDSGDIRIKIIDNETDKVIRVLPPEELERLHTQIRETIGFLIDRMV